MVIMLSPFTSGKDQDVANNIDSSQNYPSLYHHSPVDTVIKNLTLALSENHIGQLQSCAMILEVVTGHGRLVLR